MKKVILFFLACITGQFARSQQWTGPDASNNIYNNNSGNVGVGGLPTHKLTVVAASQGDGIWMGGTTGTTNIALLNNMTLGSWNGLTQAGDNMLLWKGSTVDNTNAGGLVIAPWSLSNTGQGIRISSSGSVGIGASNPRNKLDIWGGGLSITGSDFNGTIMAGTQSGIAYIGCNTLSNGIAISSSGSVGIGTTNAGTNKLAVEGTIAARKVIVTLASPFPDYVFQPRYQLPSLDSVSKFIRANHHLPGLPSAENVQKNGLDLGITQAKLLEKIEELTLYTIELQKKVKYLETANKKQKSLQQQIDELKALLKKG